jgi:hypothetical protein
MSYIDLNFIATLICRFWYIYGRRKYLQNYVAARSIVVMGNEGMGLNSKS